MNKYIITLGLGGLVASYILFTAIFICTIFDGSCIVFSNRFGEKWIEIVVQAILLPFVVLFVVNVIKEYEKGDGR